MSDVTIVGLGAMGVRLVELLIAADKSVTVWNRNVASAALSEALGATIARSPAEAFAASPVTLLIVADDPAVSEILASDGAMQALDDRLIVNIGTSGPSEAKEFSTLIAAQGGRYLDGAIQAAPSQMGTPDTLLLLAGERAAFDAGAPLLRILAGNLVHVGEAPDAAAFMDLATLSYVYGSYAGFLHGARMAEMNGIDPGIYGGIVRDIAPSFGAFFAHQGGVIASDDFTISESPMRISISAIDRLLGSSDELGINREVPALMHGWLKRAEARGLADLEVAALIKIVREPSTA